MPKDRYRYATTLGNSCDLHWPEIRCRCTVDQAEHLGVPLLLLGLSISSKLGLLFAIRHYLEVPQKVFKVRLQDSDFSARGVGPFVAIPYLSVNTVDPADAFRSWNHQPVALYKHRHSMVVADLTITSDVSLVMVGLNESVASILGLKVG